MSNKILSLILIMSLLPVAMAHTAQRLPGYLYVTTSYPSSNILIVNTQSNAVTGTIQLPANSMGYSITATPDGRFLYVTDYQNSKLYKVSVSAKAIVSTINVSADQYHAFVVKVTPNGRFVWVLDAIGDTINVYGVSNGTLVRTMHNLTYFNDPFDVTFTSDMKHAYVSNYNLPVAYVNLGNYSVTSISGSGGGNMYDANIGILPDGHYVYVANSGNSTVTVIDARTNTVTKRIQVGNSPVDVIFGQDGHTLYVSNWENRSVSVIDTRTNRVTGTIPTGSVSPYWMYLDGRSGIMYATDFYGRSLIRINTNNDTAMPQIQMPYNTITADITGLPGWHGCGGDCRAGYSDHGKEK